LKDRIARVAEEVPRETGFDNRDAEILVISDHSGHEATITIDVFNVNGHHAAEGQIADELLRPLAEILTRFRRVDSVQSYAYFATIAQHADSVPLNYGDDSTAERRACLRGKQRGAVQGNSRDERGSQAEVTTMRKAHAGAESCGGREYHGPRRTQRLAACAKRGGE
jgi:hypothetical protein